MSKREMVLLDFLCLFEGVVSSHWVIYLLFCFWSFQENKRSRERRSPFDNKCASDEGVLCLSSEGWLDWRGEQPTLSKHKRVQTSYGEDFLTLSNGRISHISPTMFNHILAYHYPQFWLGKSEIFFRIFQRWRNKGLSKALRLKARKPTSLSWKAWYLTCQWNLGKRRGSKRNLIGIEEIVRNMHVPMSGMEFF